MAAAFRLIQLRRTARFVGVFRGATFCNRLLYKNLLLAICSENLVWQDHASIGDPATPMLSSLFIVGSLSIGGSASLQSPFVDAEAFFVERGVSINSASHVETLLGERKIVPVVSVRQESAAGPLANALVSGGLPVAEVTFRTQAAEHTIRVMSERGDMLVGAGTVLTPEQANKAQQAGASFAVSPGFNSRVVRHCQQIGLPIFPGVSTPTDIEMALEHGLKTVKFFPAEAFGGVATLRALSAPYAMMRFIPTGGINPDNLASYLALENVIACGGAWLAKPDLIDQGHYQQIEQAAREAVAL